MSRPRLTLVLGVALFWVAGCSDQGLPTDSPAPFLPLETGLAVSDGTVTDGNPHFFWLPPVAPSPNASGVPNLGLLAALVVRVCPGVELCESWVFDEHGTNLALAEFTDAGGTGSSAIEVGDEAYQIGWKTSETETGESLGGSTVRVWVLLGKAPVEDQIAVGFLDVTFAADGGQARGRNSGDVLREGRMLPIRFRMENGVAFGGDCLDGSGLDCVEFTGSNDGFAECTEEDWSCLEAEEGWLPDGFEGPVLIQVKQEPLVDGSCFDGLAVPQREACYRITTVPDLGGAEFNAPVYFGMCQDPDLPDNFEIHQRTSGGQLRRPESGPATLPGLDCDSFDVVSMNPFQRLARSLHEFVFGSALYARDGFTATLIAFSEFFWGPSVEFAGVTAPATAGLGDVVEVELQLGLDHGNSGELGGITLEIDVDGGSVSGSFMSDVNGIVTVDWTVPTDPGDYELTATIPVFVAAEGEEHSITVIVEVGAAGPAIGSIEGFVTNVDNENSVEGAFVSTPQLNPGFSINSNSDGFYELVGVPVGLQAVQVALTGFESMIAYVEVPEDDFVTQGFDLWPAPAVLGLNQMNDPQTSTTTSCGPTGSLFQGFSPTGSPLARVELRARLDGQFPTPGMNPQIRIRQGSPAGSILAEASTLVQGTGGADVWVDFQISPALVVLTGQTLVIEWIDVDASEMSWYETGDTYAGGIAYGCGGGDQPAIDRSFRTSTFVEFFE